MRNFLLHLCVLGSLYSGTNAATTTEQQQQQQQKTTYSTRTARRERNLDHWDAETLAYYLGVDPTTAEPIADASYVGQDAAVMFYASWCRNCQAFAGSWDAIATYIHAGTVQSNVVMALFDCELDYRHSKLCSAAGVKHYPTLLYIGSGPYHDTDPVTRTLVGKDKSAGPAGAAPLPRTVKFQGNWQLADSVLDWVRFMRSISKWHYRTTHGFLRILREGLLGFLFKSYKKKNAQEYLPVGIPPQASSASSSSTPLSSAVPRRGGDAAATDPQVKEQTAVLEMQLQRAKDETKAMSKLASTSSALVSSVLFPATSNTTDRGYVDVFAELSTKWDDDKTKVDTQVFKTCVMELSTDYCGRLTTRVVTDYVDETPALEIPDDVSVVEELLRKKIGQEEPYCVLVEECVKTDFASAECRAPSCPFQQDVACRYLTACADETIQTEYALALGFIKEGEKFDPKGAAAAVPDKTAAPASDTAAKGAAGTAGAWGM